VIAAALRLGRSLTPTAWLALAVLAAFLIFGAYCSHRGAENVRERQAAKEAKIETKASGARQTGAVEALTETATITNRKLERDHAAQALPDSLPDDRELRRRCRQLRDAGRSLPTCRGLEGPT
jgi:hypothetical protein